MILTYIQEKQFLKHYRDVVYFKTWVGILLSKYEAVRIAFPNKCFGTFI